MGVLSFGSGEGLFPKWWITPARATAPTSSTRIVMTFLISKMASTLFYFFFLSIFIPSPLQGKGQGEGSGFLTFLSLDP